MYIAHHCGLRAFSCLLLALQLSLAASCTGIMSKTHCLQPALPRGAFHVVVAGFELHTPHKNWLWALGLTNADVFIYRRVKGENSPLQEEAGACGVRVHERLLLPNKGKEAAAFYDYVAEHYNALPVSLVFLHGHGPSDKSHTPCGSVFSRVRLYYQQLSDASFSGEPPVITLTGRADGSGDVNAWSLDPQHALPSRDTHSADAGYLASFDPLVTANCTQILARHGQLFDDVFFLNWKGFQSCCASFIVPGERLRRLPKMLYWDLRRFVLQDPFDFSTARVCFEDIIWGLLQETRRNEDFYRTADVERRKGRDKLA